MSRASYRVDIESQLLAMEPGDIIEVFEKKVEEREWWLGVNHSVLGSQRAWFPSELVQVIASKPPMVRIHVEYADGADYETQCDGDDVFQHHVAR